MNPTLHRCVKMLHSISGEEHHFLKLFQKDGDQIVLQHIRRPLLKEDVSLVKEEDGSPMRKCCSASAVAL
jgi:hypothetical protein